jgi:hypothetical protein
MGDLVPDDDGKNVGLVVVTVRPVIDALAAIRRVLVVGLSFDISRNVLVPLVPSMPAMRPGRMTLVASPGRRGREREGAEDAGSREQEMGSPLHR